jgi:hypothetical protein
MLKKAQNVAKQQIAQLPELPSFQNPPNQGECRRIALWAFWTLNLVRLQTLSVQSIEKYTGLSLFPPCSVLGSLILSQLISIHLVAAAQHHLYGDVVCYLFEAGQSKLATICTISLRIDCRNASRCLTEPAICFLLYTS